MGVALQKLTGDVLLHHSRGNCCRVHDIKAMFPEGKIHEPLGLELANYREQGIRLALKTTEFNKNMFVSGKEQPLKGGRTGEGGDSCGMFIDHSILVHAV